MEVVKKEVAQKEFDQWFENRKLPKTRREGDNEEFVKELVCAIEEGYVVILEDGGVELKLREPISGEYPVNSLKFKSRITAGELQAKTSYAKDSAGKQIATLAALTDEVGGSIRALGSVDYSIAVVISTFY